MRQKQKAYFRLCELKLFFFFADALGSTQQQSGWVINSISGVFFLTIDDVHSHRTIFSKCWLAVAWCELAAPSVKVQTQSTTTSVSYSCHKAFFLWFPYQCIEVYTWYIFIIVNFFIASFCWLPSSPKQHVMVCMIRFFTRSPIENIYKHRTHAGWQPCVRRSERPANGNARLQHSVPHVRLHLYWYWWQPSQRLPRALWAHGGAVTRSKPSPCAACRCFFLFFL